MRTLHTSYLLLNFSIIFYFVNGSVDAPTTFHTKRINVSTSYNLKRRCNKKIPKEKYSISKSCLQEKNNGKIKSIQLSSKHLEKELYVLHFIQERFSQESTPFFHTLSLLIHYSISPKILTPVLALVGWTLSIPIGASLTCFLCFQDMINILVKWTIRRPRPTLWHEKYYSSGYISSKQTPKLNIEDRLSKKREYENNDSFSFPSAHTQFFSGLAFCAIFLFNKKSTYHHINDGGNNNFNIESIIVASVISLIIGTTRCYLGVHWPTDTLFGMGLGGLFGLLWGMNDPFGWIMKSPNPKLLSLSLATFVTFIFVFLSFQIQNNPAMNVERQNLDERQSNSNRELEPEDQFLYPTENILRKKIISITTFWCLLVLSPFLPNDDYLQSHSCSSIGGKSIILSSKIITPLIGLVGLGSLSFIKEKSDKKMKIIQQSCVYHNAAYDSENDTILWVKFVQWFASNETVITKGLFYAILCAWTFLLTPLVSHEIMRQLFFYNK